MKGLLLTVSCRRSVTSHFLREITETVRSKLHLVSLLRSADSAGLAEFIPQGAGARSAEGAGGSERCPKICSPRVGAFGASPAPLPGGMLRGGPVKDESVACLGLSRKGIVCLAVICKLISKVCT